MKILSNFLHSVAEVLNQLNQTNNQRALLRNQRSIPNSASNNAAATSSALTLLNAAAVVAAAANSLPSHHHSLISGVYFLNRRVFENIFLIKIISNKRMIGLFFVYVKLNRRSD